MLDTLEPNPVWDEDAREETVEVLAGLRERESVTVHVWGADWCGDCRSVLPDFAAALEAAGLEDHLAVHPVDRGKDGELVEEYDVEYVPTIVIEVDGHPRARFVESEPVGAATYLADALADRVPDSGG